MRQAKEIAVQVISDLFGLMDEDQRTRLRKRELVETVFLPRIGEFDADSQARIRDWERRYCGKDAA